LAEDLCARKANSYPEKLSSKKQRHPTYIHSPSLGGKGTDLSDENISATEDRRGITTTMMISKDARN
jgi:hypothetical protein